ncbi:MAG: uroporphyrinogen decarboxylase family protein [bacterium]
MTNKERFLTALKGGTPDAVPYWEQGINEVSIIGAASHFTKDLPPNKLIHEMDAAEQFKLLFTLKNLIEELDMDAMTVPTLTGRELLGGNKVRDKLGVISQVTPHGEPFPIEGPIKSEADLAGFKMPVPDDSFMMAAQFAVSSLGGRRAVVLHSPGTFKLSWSLRGSMETLLGDFILNPTMAHTLARLVTDYCISLYERAFKVGIDAVILEGDLAMNATTLMSPKHYREFVKPYHREITDAVHRFGGLIAKHSDGNLWPIVDDLVEAGFDGIHPIQPQCMDIGEVKKHLTGRAAVLGNIDCIDLLVKGTPEDVDKNVHETIRTAGPGGGYILSSSNSIHPDVKPENFIAMCRAARKYGRYPIE